MIGILKKIFRPLRSPLFLDVLKEYSYRQVKELNLKEITALKYESQILNITDYFRHKNLLTLTVKDIRVRHMEEMRLWLKEEKKMIANRAASRHAELCKRAMNFAVQMEYVRENPLMSLKSLRDPVKSVVALTLGELDALQNRTFHSEPLQRAAHLYLFQCYTGLSYGDLWGFSISEIEGKKYITGQRNKTGAKYIVPLFDQAKKILDWYNGGLPYMHNQTYNRMLKEIAGILGIFKRLTTHTGRKTFATLMDQQGVSLETISDMMANTPQVAYSHYLADSPNRVIKEMDRFQDRPDNTNKKLGA